jgi:hypothetical protein
MTETLTYSQVVNSTSLDCSRKFRNFKRSGLALQKTQLRHKNADAIFLTGGI